MRDTKSFYADRAKRMGFATIDQLQNKDASVAKMTASYQEAAFKLGLSVMGNPGDTLIDVGCGTGELLPTLRAIGWTGKYVGVDIVDAFVRGCSEAYAEDKGASFVCGDYTERSFAKSLPRASTITAFSVFGLVDNPSLLQSIAETAMANSPQQYVFTCNSEHGYGKKVNPDTKLYRPQDVLTMVSRLSTRFDCRHHAIGGSAASLMAWSIRS